MKQGDGPKFFLPLQLPQGTKKKGKISVEIDDHWYIKHISIKVNSSTQNNTSKLNDKTKCISFTTKATKFYLCGIPYAIHKHLHFKLCIYVCTRECTSEKYYFPITLLNSFCLCVNIPTTILKLYTIKLQVVNRLYSYAVLHNLLHITYLK